MTPNDKDMVLLAFRYALTQNTLAADIVLKWFQNNLQHFDEDEIIFLIKERSQPKYTTLSNYKAKSDVWNKWITLMNQRLKELST